MDLKKIINPIAEIVKSNWKIVVYVVVGIVAISVLYFSYSSIANAVERERQRRAEEIKSAVTQATQKLQTDAKNMEERYKQANQKLQQQLTSISIQRNEIDKKISEIQTSVVKITETRSSIEKHEYTKSELDTKFHSILVRSVR